MRSRVIDLFPVAASLPTQEGARAYPALRAFGFRVGHGSRPSIEIATILNGGVSTQRLEERLALAVAAYVMRPRATGACDIACSFSPLGYTQQPQKRLACLK